MLRGGGAKVGRKCLSALREKYRLQQTLSKTVFTFMKKNTFQDLLLQCGRKLEV